MPRPNISRYQLPIWVVPLFIAAIVALVGWWGNEQLSTAIDDQLKSDLDATLDANVTALKIWAAGQTRIASSLAEEPTVRTLATEILKRPPLRGEPASPEADDLADFLRPRLSRMDYETAQLVDTNFIIAATSGRMPFGVGLPVSEAHTNKYAKLFATGEPVIITPFKPELLLERRAFANDENRENRRLNRPAFNRRRGDITLMQVAAPFRDHGIVIGALALIINPTNEFSKILSVAHRGETGETFAFDQTGLLISQSRHDGQLKQLGLLTDTNAGSALNLRLFDPGGDLTQGFKPVETTNEPLMHLVANAIDGVSGVGGSDVTPSRDYRGVPVVGAWRWLPQFGIGVATEMEAGEAFWLLDVLQFVFVLLFLLLVLCAVIMFIFSYLNRESRQRLNEAELKLQQLGQYSLEEKIGEGSMGVVYRARHALMRRDTAVKLLLPELANAISIERFQREVHLTCQLAHPNTIQIYDYGRTPDGVFYYAMEFLNGLNLRQLVDEYGPQPEGRVINILTQICNSLAEAHTQKLVHRDIKPSNVFISERGGVPDYVKVLDFGLVREYTVKSDGATGGDNEIVGTPWFMSPEAIRNPETSDPRSDIYSVGGLAYYLLTGNHVFEHESAEEVYQRQLTAVPVPPSHITTNPISAELDEIILRCLEKNPEDRPQSVLELFALLLTSPCANDSTPEARAAWWQNFHAQKNAKTAPADGEDTTTLPGVKIDFDSRMES